MSPADSESFAEVLKAAGAAESLSSTIGANRPESERTLLLRAHSDSGTFLRTLVCKPSSISVLLDHESAELASFRAALLQKQSASKVSMRLGVRELHASEVHVVGSSEYLWREKTVERVLAASGMPTGLFADVLTRIDLSEQAGAAPQDLGKDQRRRLAIVCSFFKKAQVLFYDKPFADLSNPWISDLAEMMLETARIGNRIMLVAGVQKVPSVWQQSELVHVEGKTDKRKASGGAKNGSVVNGQMRGLMGEGRSNSPASTFFITRPQEIHRRGSAGKEALQAEAIANPHAAVPGVAAEDQDQVSMRRSGTGSMRRSPSGKLTRVTGTYKIRRSRTVSEFLRFYRGMKKLVQAQLQPAVTPIEGRLYQLRRGRELKGFLLVLLLLILSLLYLHWV